MKKVREKLNAKLRKSGGFTLVEMLIVVAIIAILIMISMPLIGANLEKARVAVDEANERTAQSMAETYFLLNSKELIENASAGSTIIELYYQVESEKHQGKIVESLPAKASFSYGVSSKETRGIGTGATKEKPEGKGIKVTVDFNGDIQTVEWKDGSGT